MNGRGRSALAGNFWRRSRFLATMVRAVPAVPARARSLAPLAAVLLCWGAACCTPLVTVGPPQLRYDHNRSRALELAVGEPPATTTRKRKPRTEDYAPYASASYPIAVLENPEAPDKLAPARLVAIYPGVLLPLSPAECAPPGQRGCVSDRADLIDFLGTGRGNHGGIEPPDTMGALAEETEKIYKPILDLVATAVDLADAGALRKAAKRIDAEVSDRVIDSRYAPGTFASTLALGHRDFWFVLHQPAKGAFSRLVVVPKSLEQEFTQKKVVR